jgi:hypothetical protein
MCLMQFLRSQLQQTEILEFFACILQFLNTKSIQLFEIDLASCFPFDFTV